MLKRFVRAATATCLAAGLAATAPAIAQTTLEFPTWQAEEPGVSTWWKDLVAAYEKKHPDVKINLQQVPFAQFVKHVLPLQCSGEQSLRTMRNRGNSARSVSTSAS